MRLNKRDLAKKLGVSERALTTWASEGLPVLEHGRRGQENVYDLAAVVRWLRVTGRGMPHGGRPGVNLVALDRELGGAPAVQTSAPAGPSSYAIVRAIALTRLSWLGEMSELKYLKRVAARDLIQIVDVFAFMLTIELQNIGFTDLGNIYDASLSDDYWPETFEEIRDRCRAEIPPPPAPR